MTFSIRAVLPICAEVISDHVLGLGIADRIHDAALVGGAVGAPLAGLGAGLRRQVAVAVCPFADRQGRGRGEDGQGGRGQVTDLHGGPRQALPALR